MYNDMRYSILTRLQRMASDRGCKFMRQAQNESTGGILLQNDDFQTIMYISFEFQLTSFLGACFMFPNFVCRDLNYDTADFKQAVGDPIPYMNGQRIQEFLEFVRTALVKNGFYLPSETVEYERLNNLQE